MDAVARVMSAVADVTRNRRVIVPGLADVASVALLVVVAGCFFDYFLLILPHRRRHRRHRFHRHFYPTANCVGVYFVVAAAASLTD